MNRRNFLMGSTAATVALPRLAVSDSLGSSAALASSSETNVSVLVVDTDRVTTQIDERIYGHFLEHINHSVEDGLFAEQIRGAGFEGDDFKTYWTSFSDGGTVEIAEIDFQNGKKSVRLTVGGGRAGIRQGRLFLEPGFKYGGSLWVKREAGSPQLILHFQSSQGGPIASVPLALTGSGWQEVPFSFTSTVRDTQATIEIAATGKGALLVDFISMMRADVRRDGMLRPDLLQALRDLPGLRRSRFSVRGTGSASLAERRSAIYRSLRA